MEFNFGILLIISSSILFSPLALCHPAPASYISDIPASAPGPSFAPESSPIPSPSPSHAATFLFTDSGTSKRMAPESSPSTSHFTEFTTQKDSFSYTGDVGTQLSAVKKICGVTEDPDLCVDSILPNLKGAMDPVNALQSEINTFVSIASKAIEQIKISMDDPSTSSTASEGLQVCLEIYGSAHANLKQAQDAISSHDMDLLKSVLSGAITDLGTCDDAFAESGEELPLDNDLVATMHKLANNCMDISAVLLV